VLGNFASSFLEAYRAGAIWRPSVLAMLFGLIVGMVLLPGATDANKMNGEREELVQFATVFTYGMGWQTLLGAAIQAVSGG
jgi:xanthine/uracil permease